LPREGGLGGWVAKRPHVEQRVGAGEPTEEEKSIADYIVTEYGIAIARPDFRADLRKQAQKLFTLDAVTY